MKMLPWILVAVVVIGATMIYFQQKANTALLIEQARAAERKKNKGSIADTLAGIGGSLLGPIGDVVGGGLGMLLGEIFIP